MNNPKFPRCYGECYFLNESTNTLDNVNVNKVIIEKSREGEYNALYFDKEDTLIGVNIKKWYKTKDDYELNNSINPTSVFCDSRGDLIFVELPSMLETYDEDDGEISLEYNQDLDDYGLYAWVWVNNNAKEVFLPLVQLKLSGRYLPKIKVEDNENVVYYRRRDDAFKANEYIVKREDGTTYKEIGIAKSIELTNSQMDLIKKFIAVSNELEEAGVGIYVDLDGQGVRVYNKANGARIVYYENVIDDRKKLGLRHSYCLGGVKIDCANWEDYYFEQPKDINN